MVAVVVAVTSVSGCARSQLDICVDHLQRIAGGGDEELRVRCADLIEQNGGTSPF